MPLHHFTARHAIQVLATQSRRADLSPFELAQRHRDLGRYLGYELLEHLPLAPCEIQHPQGMRSGLRIAQEQDIVLLGLLRAGLYVTEGLREVLRDAPVHHVTAERGRGLPPGEVPALPGRTLVVADAVINTGETLRPVLQQLRPSAPRDAPARVFVVSLVVPTDNAAALAQEFPEVTFLIARLSENRYVGAGATDTGNRLLGTLPHKG